MKHVLFTLIFGVACSHDPIVESATSDEAAGAEEEVVADSAAGAAQVAADFDAHAVDNAPEEGAERWLVSAEATECSRTSAGSGAPCPRIRRGNDEAWTRLYTAIDGFEPSVGSEYEIDVRLTPRQSRVEGAMTTQIEFIRVVRETALSSSQPSSAPGLPSRMELDVSECGREGGHGVFDFQCPEGEELFGEIGAGVCCLPATSR